MNCPKCGSPIAEGKAYCENPSCGAVPAAAPPARRVIKLHKELKFDLTLDFATLARAAAFLITALAAAYLYFFAAR